MASAYWREREEENRRHLIANEKEMAAHAGDIYDRMMRSAQKEIDSFYQRYAKKEGITLADAKQRISKADMDYLSKQAAKYVGAAQRDMENGSGTTGDYFSKQADDEMRLYNATMKINRLEFLKGEIGSHLVDGFDEMNRYFDGKFTEHAMEEFRRRAMILGETVPADLEVRAEKIVNGSFRNAKYSDRLWQHQDMLRMEIGRQLERGLLQGVGSREQAREIRKIFGGSQKNAERLMRTEMCRISTEVAREHYQRNGNKHFQYMALGMNPCPICEALDGKIFPVSDMEAGLNAPPMHPNCHCSTGPAYSEEEEKLYNDWLESGAAAEGVSLEEYEERKMMSRRADIGNWPIPGVKINSEQLQDLIDYGARNRIEVKSFENFDGDTKLIKDFIDGIMDVSRDYPEILSGKRPLQLRCSYQMDAADYAETTNHCITLNGNAYRNRDALRKDYEKQQEGTPYFVKGTTYRNIPHHESGHLIQQIFGLSAKKIVGNLDQSKVSDYALKSNSETVAESFSAHYACVENETASQIKQNCDMMILERRMRK